jgi:hypothetical protein
MQIMKRTQAGRHSRQAGQAGIEEGQSRQAGQSRQTCRKASIAGRQAERAWKEKWHSRAGK